MTEQLKMHPEVAKAVLAVCRKVPKLGKDELNRHGGYKYVSIDQFNDLIGGVMAECGLVLWTQQTKTEIVVTENSRGEAARYLHASYELWLIAEGGESFGPTFRDVTVVATGPQAYAAAQSYVEKYFMRSLFRVPTGEQDADAAEKTPLPANRRERARQEAPSLLSEEESATTREMMKTALSMVANRKELVDWAADHSALKARLQPEDGKEITKFFAATQTRLRMEAQREAEQPSAEIHEFPRQEEGPGDDAA